mmetsp:Transcript_59426/g.133935  ORF Transcript_59426/g.133935 Transcript_59426/m.133935 type:complete len:208 (+) Transcript_59426:223-846(+)
MVDLIVRTICLLVRPRLGTGCSTSGALVRQQPRRATTSRGWPRLGISTRSGVPVLHERSISPVARTPARVRILLEHVPEPAERLQATEEVLRSVQVVIDGLRVGLYPIQLLSLVVQRAHRPHRDLLGLSKRPPCAFEELSLTPPVHQLRLRRYPLGALSGCSWRITAGARSLSTISSSSTGRGTCRFGIAHGEPVQQGGVASVIHRA